ncbi:TetR/AcrR family transcriptional regulator [Streptomyces gilvus]|uniref:TetR/AcrR family transcriptional regulator n=1 Tax=Streptomyces gilvus TaxID=2920937 RepID=UPI001F1017D7|nr:TetR/AcrR family transcriptional regulator [Streptomyces sp. CME 23]MCH5677617.1 TetR/AcrR family transcriptional regulator [Streptomyces sp. CME 23]
MKEPKAATVGRPLSREREEALLDAALEVLSQVGYDRLTVGAVCEAAGASTKTAYRRWANKDELMAAALQRAVEQELAASVTLADTGTLRGDLIANMESQAASEKASPNLAVGLIVASRIAGDLGAFARELIRRHETAYCTDLLTAAAERGEIGPDVDAEYVADAARSFYLHELLVHGVRPDRARIARFVDRVLLPLCHDRKT